MNIPAPLPRPAAEALGAQVLAWMAADPDRIARFAGVTGAEIADLRAAAGQPEFLGFVLDFLLSDEAMLIECCVALGIQPDRPFRARAGLPGGDMPHWT